MGCLPGVFRYANPQKRTHVTEKPLQLMRDLVKICEPGGRILDPFCGAGTTVLASALEGYEAVGIEATDAYYRLGSDRVRFALQARGGSAGLKLCNGCPDVREDVQRRLFDKIGRPVGRPVHHHRKLPTG